MDGKNVPPPTEEEPTEPEVCAVCGVPAWLNPTEDHEEWVGHKWTPGVVALPRLTDEGLAEMWERSDWGMGSAGVRRLIADLRASRERIKELEAKLAWVDERIDSGEL